MSKRNREHANQRKGEQEKLENSEFGEEREQSETSKSQMDTPSPHDKNKKRNKSMKKNTEKNEERKSDNEIRNFRDLNVYQNAKKLSMRIFDITEEFPSEEKYSLIDQIRRSSRSVCANLAEAWRKRKYKKAFLSKLNDAGSEACETRVWFDFALSCEYINRHQFNQLDSSMDHIIRQISTMSREPEKWVY